MKLTPKQAWECTKEIYQIDWIACDKDGDWHFFEEKPHPSYDFWDDNKFCSTAFDELNIEWEGDWKDSLHYKGMPFVQNGGFCLVCKNYSAIRLLCIDEEGIKNLFCSEKCYEIPVHKRPSQWTAEHKVCFSNIVAAHLIKQRIENLEIYGKTQRDLIDDTEKKLNEIKIFLVAFSKNEAAHIHEMLKTKAWGFETHQYFAKALNIIDEYLKTLQPISSVG